MYQFDDVHIYCMYVCVHVYVFDYLFSWVFLVYFSFENHTLIRCSGNRANRQYLQRKID